MPEKTRTLNDKLWLVFKGLAMGAANKVPGVSGGVVAFVVGFYEEFIYSLQKINAKAFALLFKGRFNSFIRYINGRFISLLILGMLISYFSVSKLLDYLIERYELMVWSVFFGMIVGSIFYIGKDFSKWNKKNISFLILGIILGASISFLEPATQNDHLLFVFVCGIISVSGMTLPGLSGSFILILLGNYVLLLVDSVNALFDAVTFLLQGDFSFLENTSHMRLLKVLISFSLGSITGLITLSHGIAYLLKHFKNATYAIIIGFITGSLGVVWPWKTKVYKLDPEGNTLLDINGDLIINNYTRYLPTTFSLENLGAFILIGIGILIVLSLGWYDKKKKK